jgi:hypothetical protein
MGRCNAAPADTATIPDDRGWQYGLKALNATDPPGLLNGRQCMPMLAILGRFQACTGVGPSAAHQSAGEKVTMAPRKPWRKRKSTRAINGIQCVRPPPVAGLLHHQLRFNRIGTKNHSP